MKIPPKVFYDFETQSALNLRVVGTKQYIQSKTTRIMSAVFKNETTGEVVSWLPHKQHEIEGCVYGTAFPSQVVKWCKTHQFVAHNGEFFDELVWEHYGFPIPKHGFMDSMHLCRMAGLPGSLNKAMVAVGLPPKTDNTAMMMLTMAKVAKGHLVYPVGPRTLWQKMLAYNVDDVTGLQALFERITQLVNVPYGVIAKHREINRRGIRVDVSYLNQLIEHWKQCKAEATDEIAELTKGAINAENITKPIKVKAWLESLGIRTESVSAKAITEIMQNPEDYADDMDTALFAISILARRQDAVRATIGKLDRIIRETDADGRARNSIVFFGAHTGRYSGRGIQVHNFPRGIKYKGVLGRSFAYSELRSLAAANGKKASDILTTLTRQVFIPDKGKLLGVLDYAAIEARGAAWVSGCDYMLSIFADHHADIYKTMAAKVTGKDVTDINDAERFLGKTMVLGLNYQMGDDKFGITCKSNSIDLDKYGLTAKQCVHAFRSEFPEVAAIWKKLDTAAITAVQNPGTVCPVGRFKLRFEGTRLYLDLPSGRPIIYRDASLEYVTTPWGSRKEAVVYTNPHGIRKTLYGGILLENGVQGMSADILSDALFKVPLCYLHVHDELVFGVKDRAEFIAVGKKVSIPPKWAKSFPLKLAGFVATEYRKSPADKIEHEFYLGKQIA
jgi:DNA polymerase